MLKTISESDLVYLCNAAGDAFWWDGDTPVDAKFEGQNLVDEHIAEPLRFAYNNIWSEDYGWPTYCATYQDRPVIMLVAEFADTELNGDDYYRDPAVKEKVLSVAKQLSEKLDCDVLFPEDTSTPFCQWECMVAVPVTDDLHSEDVQWIADVMSDAFAPLYQELEAEV